MLTFDKMLMTAMNAHQNQYTEYLAEATGLPVVWGEHLPVRLPQYLGQQYAIHTITVAGRSYLGLLLKEPEQFRPATLEKQLGRLLALVPDFQGFCLIADELPRYVRQSLVKRQIPFVVPGSQLYWPELGAVVQNQRTKAKTVAVTTVSPATQVLLIAGLVGAVEDGVNVSLLARRLGYTAMTMSRAVSELEASALVTVLRRGRERTLVFGKDRHALWQTALPYLRNPIRETVRVKERELPERHRLLAGETALATMSMLVPPKEPVYALGRDDWKLLDEQMERIPIEDDGTCRVQIWRYDPGMFATQGRVDCFSLYLSLMDEHDDRVQLALDEMMEEVAWS